MSNRLMESKEKYIFIGIALAMGMAVLFTILGVGIYKESQEKLPRFHLQSVSLDDKTTAGVWGISFSIDKSFGDLTVWVRFMARDYKVVSVGIAGNATVYVTTPPLVGAPAVLEQVMFRCNNYDDYVLEAACKDVVVRAGLEVSMALCEMSIWVLWGPS